LVVWLIGISGAGKTTLGNKLNDYFFLQGISSFVLDGDLVRNFFDNDLGYSKDERIANIMRIMLSAKVLEQNNIIPIVCNISPFEHLRDFARFKFEDYNEIFLKKDIAIAKNLDEKGVYKKNINQTELVGLDIEFEEPKKSNLILNVDQETEIESFKKIISYLKDKKNALQT